jgi:tetratricopeptide (TPR) repeat protein/serine/threonine protein kinase
MSNPSPLESIFFAALEKQSSAERKAFLDEACAGNDELRGSVERMLAAQADAGSFLESPPPGVTSAVDSSELSEQPGTIIGPYKLLEQIGEGGMGVVFMADQQEPVRRRVALKVIKPGMDTRQVIARFEAERQALAVMDHPSIARVLDAGATDSGRPYFVMELVRGVPITTHCDENNLAVRERLELFASVCEAIQHAHTKGIVHRDIKPTNVLVTRQDGRAVVKVIDFGVAKAMGQQLTEKTLFTNFAQMIGTPLYMSPEQAERSGVDIDTRSDIYSLGVLLYELLTGSTPVDAEQMKQAAFDEVRRIIREDEPQTPSARISGSHTLPAIAARRHIEPGRLSKLVRGELDWIVMKALDKDRSRRYETANAFAADLLHYLHDEPVQACPPSATYRFGKFARRNRVALTTATLVALALVLGTIVSTWQAIRAETARAAEVQQRDLAQANLQKARKAVDEYFTLVSESTLLEAPGLQPLRVQLLEAARQYYEGFLQQRSDDPEIQAEIAATLGRLSLIYVGLDRTDDAVSALSATLRIAEQLVSEHPYNKEYPKRLAGCFKGAKTLHRSSRAPKDPVKTMLTLRKSTELWEKFARDNPSLPGFRSDLVTMHTIIGDFLRSTGQFDPARADLQRAFEVAAQLLLEYPTVREYEGHFVVAYTRLAGLLSSSGRNAEGEIVLRRGLQVLVTLAADYPDVPGYRADLGRAYGDLAGFLREKVGKPGEAEKLYIVAREILEQLAAESPADGDIRYVLSWCHRGLALMLRDSNRFQEAEVTFRKALAVQEPLVLDFPAVPAYRAEFAGTLTDFGRLVQPARPQDAEQAYRQALAVHEKLVDDFPTVGIYQLSWLANRAQLFNLLRNTGQFQEAEKLNRQGIARLEKYAAANPRVPNYRRELARSHNLLGILLRNAGQNDEAAVELQKAQELWSRGDDPDIDQAKKAAEAEPKNGHRWHSLVVAYYNGGDWENCLWAIKKKQEVFAPSAWEFFYQAIAHWQLNHQEEARKWFHKSLGWICEFPEPRLRLPQADAALLLGLPDPGERVEQAWDYSQQGSALEKQGQLDKAKEAYGKAIGVYETLAADLPVVSAYNKKLVDLLAKTGRQQEVDEVYRQAIARLEKMTDDAQGRIYRGTLHRDSGEMDKAIADFSWVIANDPKLAEAWELRGNCYHRKGEFAKAVEDYSQEIKLKPDRWEAWNGRAWAHFHLQQWDQAVADFSEAIDRAPEVHTNWFHRGLAYLNLAQWDKAAADFTTVTERWPADPGGWYLRGQAHAQSNQHDQALSDFAKFIELKPEGELEVAHFHHNLANSLRAKGQTAEAEQEFRQALVLKEKLVASSPSNPDYRFHLTQSYLGLASLLSATNQPQEAERVYGQALAIFEKLAVDFPTKDSYRMEVGHTLWQLGYLASAAGRHDEAEKSHRQALAIFEKLAADVPTNAFYRVEQGFSNWNLGGVLKAVGRLHDAEEPFRQAAIVYGKLTSDFPDDRDIRARLTRSYTDVIEVLLAQDKQAQVEETIRQAIGEFGQLAAAHPTVPDYQRSRAALQRQLAQLQASDQRVEEAEKSYLEAINSYQKIIAEFPTYEDLWQVYSGLAQALAASNRPREAEEAYRKVVQLAGKNAGALNSLAWTLATAPDARLRNSALALELAQKVVELEPKNGFYWQTLGVAQYRAAEWKAAIAALERVRELGSAGDSLEWFPLAMANWQLDNKDEARKWYAKAVEWMDANAPTNEQLKRFRAEAAELLGANEQKEK